MDSFFGILAIVVALASFPAGYFVARCCVANVAGRVLLTLLFGAIILVVGVVGVVAGCSALGGKMDHR
ncbi:MAG: hypothetical protein P4L99_22345 [Chthoniobacter sp.]|nr:hypothetical protein [Chthoniobacter sp.]